jgi:flagellar L-ring protein precursor FlgH
MAAALTALLTGGAAADSLFNPRQDDDEVKPFVSEPVDEYEAGDIIRVLIQERIDASTESETQTEKESELDAQAAPEDNPFFIAETPGGLNIVPQEWLPNWNLEVEHEHEATGETSRTNQLVTVVSCEVVRVLPNGNLVIEGKKKVTVNREDSMVSIKGTIRPKDITPNNTVNSDQVAHAEVKLDGKGPLWNNDRRGILTRIFDWISPF